jgi:uncharacterized protein
MSAAKARVPAVEGWFTLDDPPALLGNRCVACGTYFFPRASILCRNPDCDGTEFVDTQLSRQGTVWSFTVNRYQPPPPYMPPREPFEAFAIAAVELANERMVVMGQVAGGPDVGLSIGDEVEIVLDTLFEDDDNAYVVWKWQKVGPRER